LDIIGIHVASILNMVANNTYIELRRDFVGDETESTVIWMDKVNSNIRFDIFK